MKVRHKNVITKIKRDNARAIQAKKARVKEAEDLAQGLHVLFNEMVDEVKPTIYCIKPWLKYRQIHRYFLMNSMS